MCRSHCLISRSFWRASRSFLQAHGHGWMVRLGRGCPNPKPKEFCFLKPQHYILNPDLMAPSLKAKQQPKPDPESQPTSLAEVWCNPTVFSKLKFAAFFGRRRSGAGPAASEHRSGT